MRRSAARMTAATALLALAAPAGAAGGGTGGDAGIVPLGKFRVPIIDAGRIDGDLELDLAIAPTDGGDAAALDEAQPALRAAVLGALLDFAQLRASPRIAVDAAALSQALDAAAHAADPKSGRVLILEVRTSLPRGAP